jgi:hypothetical protein
MSSLSLVLAALLAVPQIEAAPVLMDSDEPGGVRITKKEKPAWLPEAQEEVQEEPESRSKVAPAIVLGASIVAGILGGVYLSKTMDAIDRADASLATSLSPENGEVTVPTINTEAVREQQRDVLTNGIATTMLMSASIAGLVTSVVLLVSD